MGLLGLLMPTRVAKFVGLTSVSPEGQSEFRATYGGLFIVLGILPLLNGSPLLFAFAGLCWLGAAVGRVVSIVLDRARTTENALGVAFEAGFAALLLVGAPFASLI